MKQELQDKLIKEFPKLYINNRFDGFWVDDSWYDLIYNLSVEVNKLISLMPEEKQINYHVIQLKDKFSGLRYYMSCSTPEMNELISIAEQESYTICQGCSGKKRIDWSEKFCENCSVIKKLLE